jgi:hypothetical protein
MRIALIAGGQPRFTAEFLELLKQLQGFTEAHLYLTFWESDWVSNVNEGFQKIEAVLPANYKLVKLQIIKQPSYDLPPMSKDYPAENVKWAYHRRYGMWASTKMSFDMIEERYDAVIKFRPDGMLNCILDISKLDLKNNELVYPNYPRNGTPGEEICDQFVVGTYEGLKFYCDLINHFKEYVPNVSQVWEDDIHTWASEHILAYHIKVNNRKQLVGDYGHILAGSPGSLTHGRSKFTDNHYHHPVIEGPI